MIFCLYKPYLDFTTLMKKAFLFLLGLVITLSTFGFIYFKRFSGTRENLVRPFYVVQNPLPGTP